MPSETSRKLKRKRLRFGGGNSDTVDIPVIDEISFVDPKSYFQEYGYRVNNTAKASREVRVQRVKAARVAGGGVAYSEAIFIDVERIKTASFADPKTHFQEYGNRVRSDDPPPTTPENDDGGDKRHRKVHYIRYTKDGTANGKPWVDVELIDQLAAADPKTHFQESIFRLRNPAIDDLQQITDPTDPYAVNFVLRLGFCDPDLELAQDDTQQIDPPWRIDPFQNVVNIHGSGSEANPDDAPRYASSAIGWLNNSPGPGSAIVFASGAAGLQLQPTGRLWLPRTFGTPHAVVTARFSGILGLPEASFAYHADVEPFYIQGDLVVSGTSVSITLTDTYPTGNLGELGTWSIDYSGTYTVPGTDGDPDVVWQVTGVTLGDPPVTSLSVTPSTFALLKFEKI